MTPQLFFFVAAFVLALYGLNEAKWKGAINWAVALLSLGLIWASLPSFR